MPIPSGSVTENGFTIVVLIRSIPIATLILNPSPGGEGLIGHRLEPRWSDLKYFSMVRADERCEF